MKHPPFRWSCVRWGVAMLCCVLLAGCGLFSSAPSRSVSGTVPGNSGDSVGRVVASGGCGHASVVMPGTSADERFAVNPAESLGQDTRMYRVHVPSGYRDDVAIPLVMYFHGYGGNALGGDRSSGFTGLSEQDHFIVAYGQGLQDVNTGKPFWADVGPIDYGIDDVNYVGRMIDDLQQKFCIDAHRVFVTGFSNGGGLSNLLACRLAGRIAAAAPVSGDFYVLPDACRPSRPIAVLDIHGTADPVLPYNGESVDVNPAWPRASIPQWLQGWAGRDGCGMSPAVFLQTAQVLGERWSGCKGGAEVVHYRIEGGGHSWPGMLGGRSAVEVMWDFFEAHPLP